jgi:hypothetical protein
VTWTADWLPLPAESPGADEDAVIRLYHQEVDDGPAWSDLAEWQRKAWRRELRDT